MKIQLSKEEVHNLLPQKQPIFLVDALVEYSDTHLVSELQVIESNIFVENNQLTEPGLIEHLAQSVALHTGYAYHLQQKPAPMGYIGSIQKLNIYSLPNLNDVIQTKITIIQEFMGITLVEITASINENIIADAQMKTVIAQ